MKYRIPQKSPNGARHNNALSGMKAISFRQRHVIFFADDLCGWIALGEGPSKMIVAIAAKKKTVRTFGPTCKAIIQKRNMLTHRCDEYYAMPKKTVGAQGLGLYLAGLPIQGGRDRMVDSLREMLNLAIGERLKRYGWRRDIHEVHRLLGRVAAPHSWSQ